MKLYVKITGILKFGECEIAAPQTANTLKSRRGEKQ